MDISTRFVKNRLLSELSTFRIGGPARFFLEVKNPEEMQQVVRYCFLQKLPYFILGKGSNSLFDDRGYNGLVILNKIAFCEEDGSGKFHVGAGYSFSLLGAQTARKKWAGLEFASGIPGTVGGAVYMNAGANGHETKDTLVDVTYISDEGEIERAAKNQLAFGYRFSSFQKKRGAIVSATFQLLPSEEARTKQLKIIDYRTATQPYGEPSAGCVFRNPEGSFAGALIEKAGLKGKQIGGALVSTMHGNFIVNAGSATAHDVLALAQHVKESVKAKTGFDLEMEIRCVPYDK